MALELTSQLAKERLEDGLPHLRRWIDNLKSVAGHEIKSRVDSWPVVEQEVERALIEFAEGSLETLYETIEKCSK